MIIEEILQQAIDHKATDIHLCPLVNGYKVLIRVTGKLQQLSIENNSSNLLNRLKIMADLDLSETRRSQEGQLQIQIHNHLYFIRISIVSTKKGEKVALRLLKQKNAFTLSELALPLSLQSAVYKTIHESHGLMLVCGATGAGKTTTLYACLDALNNGEKAIFTIEDPIEYEVEDFFQCEPTPAINLTASQLLKTFLRQDPDIILVGELRDAETAQLAVTAALTGHMVFATLHSNSAIDAIHRLHSWNIDFFALCSALKMILHQKMLLNDNQLKPIFSGIMPAWSIKNKPLDYNQLIQNLSLWTHLSN